MGARAKQRESHFLYLLSSGTMPDHIHANGTTSVSIGCEKMFNNVKDLNT